MALPIHAQRVLAYLALSRPGESRRRTPLAERLWPECSYARAQASLRTSLWRIGMDTALGFILAVIASGQLAKYDIVKIYPYRWQWTIGLTAVWLLCVIARRHTLNILLEKG